MDPLTHSWSWEAALACGDDELGEVVDAVPVGTCLLLRDVPVLADALAGPTSVQRAPALAALMRKLRPGDQGTSDLATLVATAPDAHPAVLQAALDQLAAAGHPTREVLVRSAARAAADGVARKGYVLAIAASLQPTAAAEERMLFQRTLQALDENRPSVGTVPDEDATRRRSRPPRAMWTWSFRRTPTARRAQPPADDPPPSVGGAPGPQSSSPGDRA